MTPLTLRTAAVAAGIVVLLDTLRVWLPSVIFVYGRAGTTPATEMGAFAALPFLLAFVGALAVRFLPAHLVAVVAATLLAGARLALQGVDGGDPQLWISTVAVTAGLWWLVALAGGAVAGRAAAVGLVAGLTVDATLHALLRSTGLAWRGGAGPWLLVAAAAAVLLAGAWRRWPPPAEAGSAWVGTARGWLAFGPVLVLHLVVAATVSRLHTVTGWAEPVAVGVVVGGFGLAATAGWWAATSGRGRNTARPGAAVVLLGLGGALAGPVALGPTGALITTFTALGHFLLPIGSALVLGGLLATPGGAGDAARGAACAGGLVVFLALAFGYYAAYDILLPAPNTAFLWVAAALVVVVAVVAAPAAAEPVRVARRRVAAGATAGLAAGLVAALAVGFVSAPAVADDGEGLPVRVMTYNLQMGFDIHGFQRVNDQAQVILDEDADIVGLQEVSRGWLINSATDVLPRLAEQVGMSYVFTPAADRVWGNAMLSRYPMRVFEEAILPQGDAAMRRSVQAVIVELGDGTELGVVNTHLSHTDEDAELRGEQMLVVDDIARRMAAEGRPVVVLGDLNAEPGTAEMAPLEGWLQHAWDERPAGTWPSWGATQLIDHILVTDDLTARDFRIADTRASDHLPAAVTLDALAPP